jgi:hypothetical protein
MGKSMERNREIPQSGGRQRGLEYEGTPAAGQDEMRSRKLSCVQTYG